MENDLIMNHLPLPRYYDGIEWNTVIKPSRKSIPKYLHQDLPELRHLYIKQIFKQMGKFNCPNIQFFNKMIKNKKTNQKRQKRVSISVGSRRPSSYSQVKQQLQYALLVTDRNSNIVDELVEKAQRVPGSSLAQRTPAQRSKPARLALSKEHNRRQYFDNTVDLVFRNRRHKFVENLNRPKQPDIPLAFERKFQELKLIDIVNPNLQ